MQEADSQKSPKKVGLHWVGHYADEASSVYASKPLISRPSAPCVRMASR